MLYAPHPAKSCKRAVGKATLAVSDKALQAIAQRRQHKPINRTSEQHAKEIRGYVCSQGGWNMQRGWWPAESSASSEAATPSGKQGRKCKARHTAWKSKVRRNERQADAIRILRGVVDVLASVATKDMPRTKRLNKLYYSAAKYIKQLKIVKLRHLVCTWWKGPLVAAPSLSM